MSVTVPSRTPAVTSTASQSTSSSQNPHPHPVTQKTEDIEENPKSENPSSKLLPEEITTLPYTTITSKKISGNISS